MLVNKEEKEEGKGEEKKEEKEEKKDEQEEEKEVVEEDVEEEEEEEADIKEWQWLIWGDILALQEKFSHLSVEHFQLYKKFS